MVILVQYDSAREEVPIEMRNDRLEGRLSPVLRSTHQRLHYFDNWHDVIDAKLRSLFRRNRLA
jgi:hypothetical protein